jgi:hypothetical protein
MPYNHCTHRVKRMKFFVHKQAAASIAILQALLLLLPD